MQSAKSSGRASVTREGLLAADGVAVTNLGRRLAGLPERRADEDAVVLERPDGVVTLPRGWLLGPRERFDWSTV